MDIMLEVVSKQKFSAGFSISHLFGEAGGVIGRGEECDWQIPDRGKTLSRRHAVISYFKGIFYIEDVSSNGIFSSLGNEKLPANQPYRIEHGDGFILGEYTIMARLMQNPGSYAQSSIMLDQNLLSNKTLSLDPIVAMQEEDDLIAMERLGDFNDLLGQEISIDMIPADHNHPKLDTLLPITAMPDPMLPRVDPWDVKSSMLNKTPVQNFTQPQYYEPVIEKVREVYSVPETEVLFKALGYAEIPESQEERERVLKLAGQLLTVAVDGLTQAMQNRAECKNDLRLPITTTSLAISNNPLKFSPTTAAAMGNLLAPSQKGVMEPVEAVRVAFRDLHGHHMGLLAGARAAVSASLGKISPDAVEKRLDVNGPVRINRTSRLWNTFIRMHRAQSDDHESFAGIFMQDFARAYEMQVMTLNSGSYDRKKGDK